MLWHPAFPVSFPRQVRLILDIYYCFADATPDHTGGAALHPTQIAYWTGISFTDSR